MVLDTSAIVAVLGHEPEGERFRAAILSATALSISAATVLETRIVLHNRYGEDAILAFDQLLLDAGIAVVPLDAATSALAFQAFRQYGKGQGHPAQLNILDCAAYALAMTRDEPLLFKGNDFARTDIAAAL